MRYKKMDIVRTHITTTVRRRPEGSQAYREETRRLYEIEGVKPASVRPLLTTAAECREYIDSI